MNAQTPASRLAVVAISIAIVLVAALAGSMLGGTYNPGRADASPVKTAVATCIVCTGAGGSTGGNAPTGAPAAR